jgi:tRNA nucleotidyltransferase (CCA-adding enzyme)
MNKKINLILDEILKKIKPSKEEIKDIEFLLKKFLHDFNKNIKKSKLDVEVFIGGSFAKKTMIKRKIYDVDIFVRFDKKHKNISQLTEKILTGFKKTKIHGSRDYFGIKMNPKIILEIIPVVKIKNSKEAENITDLSYFHVSYAKRKLSKKVLDEIILAKAFCHANNCYGAESYIKGFSGYGLELLIYHYKSFLRFIKAVEKANKEKIIINDEKKFKNKQEILMNLNSSKLQSPIVLIDPTHKQRNVLAALSEETFGEFKKACKKFLKNPNIKSFELKEINFEKVRKDAKKRKLDFILIETKTNKQEGDIAGSKLLKFHKYLNKEIKNSFYIKNNGFEYGDNKSSLQFFVVKNKKEILFKGPKIKDKKNVKLFKKKHKKTFSKSGRVYSKEKINFNIKKFLENWKKKNNKTIKEMSISDLRILN